ncbi:hypothetical protein [Planctomicrobium sp. SH527]|uniref:hypothetical protein n=1 Tax=Planctomicrobium sp. SH527 TaxID=3448123 RepID=UPI003F5AFEB6
MPPEESKAAQSAVPGIAIFSLFMVGGLSILLSLVGFVAGIALVGVPNTGAIIIGSALMMAIAAATFAWLTNFCFRKH